MSDTATKQPHSVKSSDLPASCPPRDSSVASLHPRVYLKFDSSGSAKCPYCSAKFVLEN